MKFNDENRINIIEESYYNKVELSESVINSFEESLKSDEYKKSSDYFIAGYISMLKGYSKEAYEYFGLAIAKETDETNMFARLFSRKYVAEQEYKADNNKVATSYIKSAYKIINKDQFNKYYKILVDTLMVGVDYDESSRTLVIKYLNSILDSKSELKREAKLYIDCKVAPLYIIEGDYAEGIEASLESIMLSREANNKYIEAKSVVDLGLVFRMLGRYEIARNTIEGSLDINILNEEENAIVKLYALSNLSDINIIIENYSAAIDRINEMERYISLIQNSEERNDYEITKDIILSKVNIHNNNLQVAEEQLTKVGKLLKSDKKIYIADKDIDYIDTLGELEEARGKYKEAIKLYNKSYDLAVDRKNTEKIILILRNICDIYQKTDETDKLAEAEREMINIMNKEKQGIGEDYVYYSATLREKQQMVREESRRKYRDGFYFLIFIFTALIGYKYINKLIKATRYDSLTKVYNRGRFNKKYNKMLKGKNKEFSLVMLDIDNFKSINDNFGHDIGDIVLINVCNIIKNVLGTKRELYRYGGEEFIVIFKDEDRETVNLVAERIRRNVEAMIWKENLTVTISLGVAFSTKVDRDILKKADQNLYKSKTNGKNRITLD